MGSATIVRDLKIEGRIMTGILVNQENPEGIHFSCEEKEISVTNFTMEEGVVKGEIVDGDNPEIISISYKYEMGDDGRFHLLDDGELPKCYQQAILIEMYVCVAKRIAERNPVFA